jgi:peptide/nickel transport system substrate-binding protein
MQSHHLKLLAAATLTAWSLTAGFAQAAGVLTIGCREDSTTFDPIKSAQNRDTWVFANVYDTLVRVDNLGTKMEPGLAERWDISKDGLTYTFTLRDAKFSDGSPITAADAAFSLLRIRDNKASLWSDPFSLIDTAKAADPKTLVVTLKTPAVAFLSQLASPTVSILSEKAMTSMGEDAYSENPVTSGAFTVEEWRKGDRVILKKNPNFWQAKNVSLDGVEWVSVTDDNTRMRMVQNNELDTAIFVPFSRVEEL